LLLAYKTFISEPMTYYMTVRGERPSRFTETAPASQKQYERF